MGPKGDLVICSECCASNGRGLVADIIQCSAIHEMSEVWMRGWTLERVRTKDLRERESASELQKSWATRNEDGLTE